MQKSILILWVGMMVAACTGELHQTQFYVEGNCVECKPFIESAAMKVRGVDSAGWDMQAKLLTIHFDTARITIDGLQQAISAAGFATTYYDPDSQARADLPLCCQESGNQPQLIPQDAGLPTGH